MVAFALLTQQSWFWILMFSNLSVRFLSVSLQGTKVLPRKKWMATNWTIQMKTHLLSFYSGIKTSTCISAKKPHLLKISRTQIRCKTHFRHLCGHGGQTLENDDEREWLSMTASIKTIAHFPSVTPTSRDRQILSEIEGQLHLTSCSTLEQTVYSYW